MAIDNYNSLHGVLMKIKWNNVSEMLCEMWRALSKWCWWWWLVFIANMLWTSQGQEVGCVTSDREIPLPFLNKHPLRETNEQQEASFPVLRFLGVGRANQLIIAVKSHSDLWLRPYQGPWGRTWGHYSNNHRVSTCSQSHLADSSLSFIHWSTCYTAARSSYFHSFHHSFYSPWTPLTSPLPGWRAHNQKFSIDLQKPLWRFQKPSKW